MKKILTAAVASALSFAAAGDASRDCLLNLLNARAGESPRRYEEAAKTVAAEAAAGKILHRFVIALVSREPSAPPSAKLDAKTRDEYLSGGRRIIRNLALSKENPLAWYLLYIDSNDAKLLKRAADGDNVQALNELGTKTLAPIAAKKRRSEAEVKKMRECFGFFSRAAGKDDANGFYNLGVCYLNGWGCRKDPAMALDYLSKAAAKEQPKAVNLLGEITRDGTIGDKDSVAATKYFSQCAMLGYPRGQFNYAMALLNGDGIEKNPQRAEQLMKAAAASGIVEAMDAYASILSSTGDGEENAAARRHEAVAWWRHCAVDLKYPPSMDRLAACFASGRGVERDDNAAAAWYRRAAEAGYVPAMLHIAEMFETGTGGVSKSHYNANWWKTRARAAEGDRNASVWLATHKPE